MILMIALLRSIPIFLIGVVWRKSKSATIITALISGFIAFGTGNPNYLIVDLLSIGIFTWLSISAINAFDKQPSNPNARYNPVNTANPRMVQSATNGKKVGRSIVFGLFGVVLAKLFLGPLFAEFFISKKGTPAPLAPVVTRTPEIADHETPAVINPVNHKKNAFGAHPIKTIVKEVDDLPTKRLHHPKNQTYDEMWKHENEIYVKHMAEEKAIYEGDYERKRIESKRRAHEDLNRARGIPPDQN